MSSVTKTIRMMMLLTGHLLGACNPQTSSSTNEPSEAIEFTDDYSEGHVIGAVTQVSPRSSLRVFKKDSPHHRLLSNGATVSGGDVIQLVYRTDEKYMVILSKDGNGHVTVHYPEKQPCSTSVTPSGRYTPLNNAFELDDAPRYEHFYLVTAPQPICVEAIRRLFGETPDTSLRAVQLPGQARIISDVRLKKE